VTEQYPPSQPHQGNSTPGWPVQTPPEPKPRRGRRAIVVVLSAIAGGLIAIVAAVALLVGALGAAASSVDTTDKAAAPKTEQTAPPSSSPEFQDPGEEGVDPDEDLSEDEFSGPVNLKVGETAVVSEGFGSDSTPLGELTIDKVTATKSATSYGETEYPDNKWFIKVHVIAKGSKNGFDVNPLDFYVRGDDGSHYDAFDGNTFSVTADPELHANSLAKGEKLAGNIVFDVPARHGVIVYAPSMGSDAVGEWSF
jgi:hypothetical protein